MTSRTPCRTRMVNDSLIVDSKSLPNVHIKEQKTSHVLPHEVLTFVGDINGYAAAIPIVLSWRETYENKWPNIGVIDDVVRSSITGTRMFDFWYTTLCTGPLTLAPSATLNSHDKPIVNGLDTPKTLDAIGCAPAMFVNYREGVDTHKQQTRNIRRLKKYYTHLQSYHKLDIGRAHTRKYLQQRMEAHVTPLQDSVAVLMLLLSHWSQMTKVSDMHVAWNVAFHLWVARYDTGVDEALIRFANHMMQNAEVAFKETRLVCACDRLPAFVNALFQSTLPHRQISIDALTDVFQNNIMGYMQGETAYMEKLEDELPPIIYAPTHLLSEKVPHYVDGHMLIPTLDENNKTDFTFQHRTGSRGV